MNPLDAQQNLYKYLEGTATEEEVVSLQASLASNRDLAEQLYLHRDIEVWLQTADSSQLKKNLDEIHLGMEPEFLSDINQNKAVKVPLMGGWKKYMAAASVLLAVGLGSWLFFSDNQTSFELADEYAGVSVMDNITRGASDDEKATELKELSKAFNEGRYSEVAPKLQAYAVLHPSSELWINTGVAYQKTKNFSEALKAFNHVPNDSMLAAEARWQEAITFLLMDDKPSAKSILLKMVETGQDQQKSKVKELLKQLD
jgi:tetratricopeptide (TPR) repeat protein